MGRERTRGNIMSDVMNSRDSWVEVDLSVIRDNIDGMAELIGPSRLCVVVKADAYGHGMVPVAKAAVDGGASHLGVATLEEGIELRDHGITIPILLLSEPTEDCAREIVQHRLTPFVYSQTGISQLVSAANAMGERGYPVHLKVDTGMHRVGCSPSDALAFAEEIMRSGALELEGLCSHLATADESNKAPTDAQLHTFRYVFEDLRSRLRANPRLHIANSAAALRFPQSRLDMVRSGIAIYGLQPSPSVALPSVFRPALSLKSSVSYVKRLHIGDTLGYGLRHRMARDASVASVPIGYADGIDRESYARGVDVIINGRRCHLVGTVSMDQVLVDCGDDNVQPGDEVVFIGSQHGVSIRVSEVAERLGTIDYEVVSRLGKRLPRRYVG